MKGGDKMFCTNCGKELREEDNFCSHCGKACRGESADLYRYAATAQRKPSGRLNTKLFLYGIISLLGLIAPGVITIIFTLRASKATDIETEKRYLKIAKIAATIGIVIISLAVAVALFILLRYVVTSLQSIFDDLGITMIGGRL